MVNGWYWRYSWNCSVMAHLRAKILSFEEWYFGSSPFNSRLANATGWYYPSSHSFRSTAPSPSFKASVSNRKGFLKSAKIRMGAVMHFIFRSSKAWRAFGVSSSSSFSSLLALPSRRSFRGLAILEYPLMNWRKNPVMPVNHLILVYVFGGAISAIAFKLAIPGFIPSADISWPRNVISS